MSYDVSNGCNHSAPGRPLRHRAPVPTPALGRAATKAMPPLDILVNVFNPRRFASRYKLLAEFLERAVCVENVRVHLVEVAFGERPFEMLDLHAKQCFSAQIGTRLGLRTQCELWHKERALNLLFHKVVHEFPDCRYVAWVDPDITFLNHHWASETVHALQHFQVVQMFSQAVNLGPADEVMWTAPAMLKAWQDEERIYWDSPDAIVRGRKDHPGLAWAARRETLDELGGLIDFCIAGSGDLHMAGALTVGDPLLGHPSDLSPAYTHALTRWARRAHKHVNGNVGVVTGAVTHHWHGKTKERGYDSRWGIMTHHQFDPHEDLVHDGQGLYRFASHAHELARDLRRSLAARNEDSIDV